MDTLIHADVFFFVTTVAVIILTIVFAVTLFYLIAVLRRARDIAEQIKEEATLVRHDIHDARMRVEREGFRLKHVLDFFSSIREERKNKSTSRKGRK